MCCHGKLTVYLKEFIDYHLKSNAGSLSANIRQYDKWLVPSLHPHLPNGLYENMISLNNFTHKTHF